MNLELITRRPQGSGYPTPILFVHGAWHGAWCWDEYFLPYFAQQGFVAHALSFRNHGQSASVGSLRWRSGAEYVADVAQIVEQIGAPPVLVGHSLGGYVVQKYLEKHSAPATVLLASVPPHGAIGATIRTARRQPLAFLKTNLQLRLWPIIASPQLARDAFFSKDMPDEQVRRYFARMQDEAYRAYMDMVLLNLPRPSRIAPVPMLALGAADDAIISQAEIQATARTYKAATETFPHMTHDMMLEADWQMVADRIITWLQGVPGVC